MALKTVVPKVVICDIEGTTTSISFVKDTLFPYVLKNVKSFLKDNWTNEDVKDVLKAIRQQALDDAAEKLDGTVSIPDEDKEIDEQIDGIVASVEWQMSNDRKVGPLKQLQGLIWAKAYNEGTIKGHVYDDVPKAFEAWTQAGLKIYIYSSGSVEAQKLLFANTEFGDLLPKLAGHFDTKIGAKQEKSSYLNILKEIDESNAKESIFLTDIVNEAKAARDAGMNVVLLERPGNAELSTEDRATFKTAATFEEINVASFKHTKRGNEDLENEDRAAKLLKTDDDTDSANCILSKSNDETEIKDKDETIKADEQNKEDDTKEPIPNADKESVSPSETTTSSNSDIVEKMEVEQDDLVDDKQNSNGTAIDDKIIDKKTDDEKTVEATAEKDIAVGDKMDVDEEIVEKPTVVAAVVDVAESCKEVVKKDEKETETVAEVVEKPEEKVENGDEAKVENGDDAKVENGDEAKVEKDIQCEKVAEKIENGDAKLADDIPGECEKVAEKMENGDAKVENDVQKDCEDKAVAAAENENVKLENNIPKDCEKEDLVEKIENNQAEPANDTTKDCADDKAETIENGSHEVSKDIQTKDEQNATTENTESVKVETVEPKKAVEEDVQMDEAENIPTEQANKDDKILSEKLVEEVKCDENKSINEPKTVEIKEIIETNGNGSTELTETKTPENVEMTELSDKKEEEKLEPSAETESKISEPENDKMEVDSTKANETVDVKLPEPVTNLENDKIEEIKTNGDDKTEVSEPVNSLAKDDKIEVDASDETDKDLEIETDKSTADVISIEKSKISEVIETENSKEKKSRVEITIEKTDKAESGQIIQTTTHIVKEILITEERVCDGGASANKSEDNSSKSTVTDAKPTAETVDIKITIENDVPAVAQVNGNGKANDTTDDVADTNGKGEVDSDKENDIDTAKSILSNEESNSSATEIVKKPIVTADEQPKAVEAES